MKALFTGIATAHGGREGHVKSSDGILDLDLKKPKEMGGPGGTTNPEQLFAAGYAACFESAMRATAKAKDKNLTDASIRAEVTLNMSDDRKFSLSIELHGTAEGLTQEETQELMEAAHQVCPYSKATRNNVEVKLIAE